MIFKLALRMLARDARAGELGLLALAMTIAIAGVTTVSFFTERTQRALDAQAARLIGADLTIASDRALPTSYEEEAHAQGFATARLMNFPSMVTQNNQSVLAEIHVANAGYPVRGELRIANDVSQSDYVARALPNAGTVFVDARLAAQIGANVGTTISVGRAHLNVVAILTQEPGTSAFGFFNALPRLLMNEADVATTDLIQPGSRIRYRLQIANNTGKPALLSAYRTWLQTRVASWESISGSNRNNGDDNDPARGLLNRAGQYLGLTVLLGVIIAAVAIALASRRFVERHLDACAIMRCLGARQSTILRLYAVHFLVFGLFAGVFGCAIGYVAQFALAHSLNAITHLTLPNAGWFPILNGMLVGAVLLAGFAAPPLIALARVPTLRVLRRDIETPAFAWISYLTAGVAIAALVLWQARDMQLGLYVFAGVLTTALVLGAIAASVLRALARVRFKTVGLPYFMSYSVMHLQRRLGASVIQIIALGVGLMAVLTLALVRGDLLQSWNTTFGADTPNRFLINIQPDQLQPVANFFQDIGMPKPAFYPMVRGRLVAVNGKDISSRDYQDVRAQRLLDREFNLSYMDALPENNPIIAGRAWQAAEDPHQLSVEEGIAQTLHLKLGDTLTYDVAGVRFSATMTSLRAVKWDSFQVNFFVIAPTALLRDEPASWITSFHVSAEQAPAFQKIAGRFPNVVVIDVAQILGQLQSIVREVAGAVQFLFVFVLAAGVAVLWAVISNTSDARLYEAAIMRALGASRKQILQIQATEFLLTGALAGVLAAAGASALAAVLAHQVLDMEYYGTPWIWIAGVLSGALGVSLVGWLGARRILQTPPWLTLRSV